MGWRYRWWWEVLLALDRLLAALLGAWSDETLSSYAYRLERQGSRSGAFWRRFLDAAWAHWEPNHCLSSYIFERLRDRMPPDGRRL